MGFEITNTYTNPGLTRAERTRRGQALVRPIVDRILADPVKYAQAIWWRRYDERGEMYLENAATGERCETDEGKPY